MSVTQVYKISAATRLEALIALKETRLQVEGFTRDVPDDAHWRDVLAKIDAAIAELEGR